MKKINIVLFLIVSLLSCTENNSFQEVKNISDLKNTNFSPSLENKITLEKNVIYSASLLFAWNEIKTILKPPFDISKKDRVFRIFNNSKSFVNVLEKEEYNTTATVEGNNIYVSASFENILNFNTAFNTFDNALLFNEEIVPSFGLVEYNKEISKNIDIIYYKNDNNFVVKLVTANEPHEIFLFKTNRRFKTLQNFVAEIDKKQQIGAKQMEYEKLAWRYKFLKEDELLIPKLDFNIESQMDDIKGKYFKSKEEEYFIDSSYQRIAFKLNETGAKIESEAQINAVKSTEAEPSLNEQPKKLYFNRDFFIMLKRKDSKNPYFAMWVANTDLMQK